MEVKHYTKTIRINRKENEKMKRIMKIKNMNFSEAIRLLLTKEKIRIKKHYLFRTNLCFRPVIGDRVAVVYAIGITSVFIYVLFASYLYFLTNEEGMELLKSISF